MSRVEYDEDGTDGMLSTDADGEWMKSSHTIDVEDWQ